MEVWYPCVVYLNKFDITKPVTDQNRYRPEPLQTRIVTDQNRYRPEPLQTRPVTEPLQSRTVTDSLLNF